MSPTVPMPVLSVKPPSVRLDGHHSPVTTRDPREYLWDNIVSLCGGGAPSINQVQQRVKVGRGIVQRIRGKSESVELQSLTSIAKALGVEVWQLLHPAAGRGVELQRLPSIADEVARLVQSMPEDAQQAALRVVTAMQPPGVSAERPQQPMPAPVQPH